LKRSVIVFSILVSCNYGFAQQISDSAFRQEAINNIVQLYYSSIGLQARLYNGPLYTPYDRGFTEGHQYFGMDTFNLGAVAYDGLEYHNIPMKYDIIRDELIILHHNGVYPVNLIKQKIDSFSFSGHSFLVIRPDSTNSALPETGFYENLYYGNIRLLAKRSKFIQETNAATIEIKVYSRVQYYIVKAGKYHLIRNKNSLMDVLNDKRNAIQAYIKRNHLRLRKDFENDMISIVSYYDQLK
jgi:hypothetical protein